MTYLAYSNPITKELNLDCGILNFEEFFNYRV